MPNGYYPGYPPQYGQSEGFDPFAYGGYHGLGGYPGGYGPMTHYNPAARLRTISRGRLGGRPTNVTIAEHGYSDVDRNARLAANGYVPRSISAAGESIEYFEGQAHCFQWRRTSVAVFDLKLSSTFNIIEVSNSNSSGVISAHFAQGPIYSRGE